MKTRSTKAAKSELRGEYDFSKGERGVYAARYAQGSNVVVLQPDVAKIFSTSRSVNLSLRKLIQRKTVAAK